MIPMGAYRARRHAVLAAAPLTISASALIGALLNNTAAETREVGGLYIPKMFGPTAFLDLTSHSGADTPQTGIGL